MVSRCLLLRPLLLLLVVAATADFFCSDCCCGTDSWTWSSTGDRPLFLLFATAKDDGDAPVLIPSPPTLLLPLPLDATDAASAELLSDPEGRGPVLAAATAAER